MKLTDEQLAAIVQESKDEIRKMVLNSVKEDLSWHVRQVLRDGLAHEIGEVVKTEILPDVRAALLENKAGIIEGAVKASDEIGEMMREVLVEKVQKSLSDSYHRSQVIKALFD